MLCRGVMLAFCALAVFAVFAACDDGAVPQPCSDIPLGGCPIARGVSCADLACEAVYACRADNRWELVERCPARDASAPSSSPPPDATADAGEPVFDASVDAPPGAYGGPGCLSLQSPDCALGVALACGTSCCGCEDLYVCEQGGWSLWGYCGDAGIVGP